MNINPFYPNTVIPSHSKFPCQSDVRSHPRCITRCIVPCAKTVKIISIAVASFFRYVFFLVINKIRQFVNWIFNCQISDKNRLVLSQRVISPEHYQWYQNFALMRDIHDHTTDPKIKELTEFLASNYLSTAAPVFLEKMQLLGSILNIDRFHDTPPTVSHPYHRYGFIDNPHIADVYNQKLVMNQTSPLIPTDTKDFESLLPLSFTVLNEKNEANWSEILTRKLKLHFSSLSFDDPLQHDFILDVTSFLGPYIKKENKNLFDSQFSKIRSKVNEAIENAVSSLPHLNTKKLRDYVHKNLTAIARVEIEKVTGIKVLPLFKTNHSTLNNFISNTGIFVGSVNARRYFMKPISSYQDVHLGTKGSSSEATQICPTSRLALFNRLKSKSQKEDNLAIKNLCQATLKLIEGLDSKINYETIETSKRPLLAQILFQLYLHLCDVELKMHRGFLEFTSAIKLVHYDLMALLEITRPYQEKDFEPIYLSHLNHLGNHNVQASLGKTGMNVFAGINSAVSATCKKTKTPVRVYSENLYFEQSGFLGSDFTLKQALNDPSITKIDLFACQFNPNIEISSTFTHYEVSRIADDIRQIFQKKPNTDRLTVAVDCTIDYINSPKVNQLLKVFKKKIKEGKLNFVFFRSGQKFDMYGMDNYYGAPYVIVNNGSSKWRQFKNLPKNKALKIDPLSLQWFCLANEFTSKELDEYRHLIFQNTKTILKDLPPHLHNPNAKLRINTIDDKMDPCFIDIKVKGLLHKKRAELIIGNFYEYCLKHGINITSRASFGFNHANAVLISINEVPDSSSIRITPGTNPEEVKVIRAFLESLAYNL